MPQVPQVYDKAEESFESTQLSSEMVMQPGCSLDMDKKVFRGNTHASFTQKLSSRRQAAMKILHGEFVKVEARFVQESRVAKEGEMHDRKERKCSSKNSDDNEKTGHARLSRTCAGLFQFGSV